MTTDRREVTSNGVLDVTIIDPQFSKVLSQKKFAGQYVWFWEWGSFNGDERALPKEQLEKCHNKPVIPPAPQVLFVEFTKPIFDQVTSYLRSFFKNY